MQAFPIVITEAKKGIGTTVKVVGVIVGGGIAALVAYLIYRAVVSPPVAPTGNDYNPSQAGYDAIQGEETQTSNTIITTGGAITDVNEAITAIAASENSSLVNEGNRLSLLIEAKQAEVSNNLALIENKEDQMTVSVAFKMYADEEVERLKQDILRASLVGIIFPPALIELAELTAWKDELIGEVTGYFTDWATFQTDLSDLQDTYDASVIALQLLEEQYAVINTVYIKTWQTSIINWLTSVTHKHFTTGTIDEAITAIGTLAQQSVSPAQYSAASASVAN